MSRANAEGLNEHSVEIARAVTPEGHAAPVMDGAGRHQSDGLVIPSNISLLHLPPHAPELDPVENIWPYLRRNMLPHRPYDTDEVVVDARCDGWNALIAEPDTITSIAALEWANVSWKPAVGVEPIDRLRF